MKIIDVNQNHSLWNQIWKLYKGSFPDFERRSVRSQDKAMRDRDFHTRVAVDEQGELLALFFYWSYGDTFFIEHLAVSPEKRGQNVGSSLINQFIRENPLKGIILEIDPPRDEVSQRRLRFYEHLGFKMNPYLYTHPSYSTNTKPQPLSIMSYPETINSDEFDRFEKFVKTRVMAYND